MHDGHFVVQDWLAQVAGPILPVLEPFGWLAHLPAKLLDFLLGIFGWLIAQMPFDVPATLL